MWIKKGSSLISSTERFPKIVQKLTKGYVFVEQKRQQADSSSYGFNRISLQQESKIHGLFPVYSIHEKLHNNT